MPDDYRFGNQTIFFLDEECDDLHMVAFSVDWRHLPLLLYAAGRGDVSHTGLCGVTRVLAGQCHTIHDTTLSSVFYWNPLQIASDRFTGSFQEAAEQVRLSTLHCVSSWASCYDRILLLLSGGFDSSAVLGCISASPGRPSVECLNYFYPRTLSSDERLYARAAAKRAGLPLLERKPDSEQRISDVADVPRTPLPRILPTISPLAT